MTTDYQRARTIVSSLAAHGRSHAVALYGHHLCNWALFIMRGHVAQRQAKRARDIGAEYKRLCRNEAKWHSWTNGQESRNCDRISRQFYRKAARYDDTAQGAALMAQAHEGATKRFSVVRPAMRERLAHFLAA